MTEPIFSPHISRSIDTIRGAAALGVIWGHSMYGLSLPLELNGAFWVWIFLVISGFLVGSSFQLGGYEINTKGYFKFLFNRGLRILPLAYTALIIGLLIFYYVNGRVPETTTQQFLFIPELNNMSLLGPLWTIAAELKFYCFSIILIILMHAVVKHSSGITPLIIVSIILFVASIFLSWRYIQITEDNVVQPRTLLGNLTFFVLGLIMANLTKYTIYVKRISKLILIVGLIIFAWWLQNYSAGYFWTLGNFSKTAPTSGAAIVAMLIAFFVLGLNVDSKDKSWNTGISGQIIWCFRKSGFYCYGIYVWHAVLAVFNDQILKIDPGFGLFCFLLLSIPIALISYSIVEKPFLKYKLAKTSM